LLFFLVVLVFCSSFGGFFSFALICFIRFAILSFFSSIENIENSCINQSADYRKVLLQQLYQMNTIVSNLRGFLIYIYAASVAKWLTHLPFTSEAAGSSLSENFLNATRTQSSCEKSKSQCSAESHGFSPGTPVSSNRES
jgi:hypothetical protein